MLRIAADRGIPVVIGTDSHARAQITNFSLARQRLESAGLAPQDLYMPEVEDFIARKGWRHTMASRPVVDRSGRTITPEEDCGRESTLGGIDHAHGEGGGVCAHAQRTMRKGNLDPLAIKP